MIIVHLYYVKLFLQYIQIIYNIKLKNAIIITSHLLFLKFLSLFSSFGKISDLLLIVTLLLSRVYLYSGYNIDKRMIYIIYLKYSVIITHDFFLQFLSNLFTLFLFHFLLTHFY
jgi:hypothetical protein